MYTRVCVCVEFVSTLPFLLLPLWTPHRFAHVALFAPSIDDRVVANGIGLSALSTKKHVTTTGRVGCTRKEPR